MLAAFGVGGGLAFATWQLKVRFGVHEVMSCLLLNLIVPPVSAYFVEGVLAASGPYSARTMPVGVGAMLPGVNLQRVGYVNLATVLAFGVLAVYSLYHRSAAGLVVRATGLAPESVRMLGYRTDQIQAVAVFFGGGAAGLGSIVSVLGVEGAFVRDFSLGWGYAGLVVAVLADALGGGMGGLMFAAVSFGLLSALVVTVQGSWGVPKEAILVTQGAALMWLLRMRRRIPASYGH